MNMSQEIILPDINKLTRKQRREKGVKVAVGYTRVSTQGQVDDGLSLATQAEKIEEKAASLSLTYHMTYTDSGISGGDIAHRSGMIQLLEDAKSGLFDAVIIYSVSRVSRDLDDFLTIVRTLERYDIELISISELIDASNPAGTMSRNLMAVVAQFERERTSELVAESMKTVAKEGRFTGGRMLGYYCGVDEEGRKTLLIEPKGAAIVRTIFTKYASGEGYRAIANYLNRQGDTTITGKSFTAGGIKTILSNQKYGGIIEYGKYQQWKKKRRRGVNPTPIVQKGIHEPIIEEALFLKVRERLEMEKRQPNWNHRGENVLTGLLTCPVCHGPMAASNVTNTLKDGTKKRIRYYSCANFRNKGASVCGANSIRADYAEKFVSDRLRELVTIPEFLPVLVKEMNQKIEEELQPLEQELAVLLVNMTDIEKKVEVYHQFEELTDEHQEDISSQKEKLKEQLIYSKQREHEILSVLNHQHEKITVDNVSQIFTALDHFLNKADKAMIKSVYRTFIQKITFDPLTKDAIQLTMTFNEEIVHQLNQLYQETLSNQTDGVFFVLKRPFTFVL